MNAVIFGTGEYVTGWTGAEGSKSDKSLGVVALVHFDLRERGLIGDKIALCGTNGNKFEAIRNHFKEKIVFSNLPNLDFEQFPQTGEVIFLKRLLQFQLKKICEQLLPILRTEQIFLGEPKSLLGRTGQICQAWGCLLCVYTG